MSRAGRASREPGPRSAWWRVGWERRPSGRHRGPQRREIAHRQPRRSAGTAWSAGLRPASRGSAKPAPMTPGPANVSPAPHHAVGVNGPTRSCGFRPHSPPPFTPAPRSNTVAKRVLPTAARAWSAGLRPASRGSAKPAPMTPGPANVSPACRRGERTDPIMWVPAAQPPALHTRRSNTARRVLPRAARAWSAGLRPASRGSAKPAPMTPAANVSPAPHHAVGVNGPRSCGFRPHIALHTRTVPTETHAAKGSGLERRSPTGIARERETCTNDAGCQRESRTTSCRGVNGTRSCGFRPHSPPPFTPAPRSKPSETRAGSKSWSAGLRPACGAGNDAGQPTRARTTSCVGVNGRPDHVGSAPRPSNRVPTPSRKRMQELGAPVSDRHRAGARNLHQRRRLPTEQTHAPAIRGNRRMLRRSEAEIDAPAVRRRMLRSSARK